MSRPRPTARPADGALLDVRVIPRAGKSGVAGLRDGALLVRLAAAGRRWVEQRFDLRTCLEPLIERYRRCLDLPGPGASRQRSATNGSAERAHERAAG